MVAGKWIYDIGPATPLDDAARHVLTIRLGVVRDHLDSALKEADKDPEHVHQLRVGTRRAGAALEIFAGCLPKSVHRHVKKQIRRLRQTAGKARDWDVFMLVLEAERAKATSRLKPGLDFLIGYALGHRAVAQEHLVEASPDHPFGIERVIAETLAAVRRPAGSKSEQIVHALAWPMLSGLLAELNEANQDESMDFPALHRMRITGKRLRYAMEILGGCFTPPLREQVYQAVEEMQEILGRINDSNVATERLQSLGTQLQSRFPAESKRWCRAIDHLNRLHETQLATELAQFETWRAKWKTLGDPAYWRSLLLEAQGNVIPVLGRESIAGISSEGPASLERPDGTLLVGQTGGGEPPGAPNGTGAGAAGPRVGVEAGPGNPGAGTAAGETFGNPT